MISHFFIDRPIFAAVLSIVFVLAGAVAVWTLPVAQYPDVVPPTVLVTAHYPGANAETVRGTVAAPIEEQVSGVEGMVYMSSTSTNDGTYTLTVTFKLGMDSDMAQVLVQNRVNLALPVIPTLVQTEGINVQKMSPSTLMIVNLISPDGRYDSLFLSNYATIYLKDELNRLPGVAGISYLGQRDYSLRAWLDPDKMAALGIDVSDVLTAIGEQNLQVAAGQIGQPPAPKGQQFQLTVNTLGRLTTPEQFGAIIVKAAQRNPLVQSSPTGMTATATASGSSSQSSLYGPTPPATGIVYLRDVVTKEKDGKPRIELGVAAVRAIQHARWPAVGGIVHLPAARLQRAGHRQGHLRQDGGAEGDVSRRPGLQDCLRHDALRPRIGVRGFPNPARRHHPGSHRGPGVFAELARCPHPADRGARGHRRHVRRHGRPRLFAEQPVAVWSCLGHRHRCR